jgi:hypothetical protein
MRSPSQPASGPPTYKLWRFLRAESSQKTPQFTPTSAAGARKDENAQALNYDLLFLVHLGTTVNYRAFDLLDQIGDRDTARAGISAVKDGTATPHTVTSAKNLQALGCALVATVKDEAMCIDD